MSDAGVAYVGAPRLGTTRDLALCSPQDAGGIYLAAASFSSSSGIPTCGGTVPLDLDFLLLLSLDPSNPFFLNFTGNLDAFGRSTSPSVLIPNSPSLVGIPLVFGFVVIDLSLACPVARIADPLTVTIQ